MPDKSSNDHYHQEHVLTSNIASGVRKFTPNDRVVMEILRLYSVHKPF